MKIIVCIKQVPDTNEIKIDPVKGTLIREGVPSIMNPEDENALEEALRIKDKNENVDVVVITMGPPQADIVLREALAMGADDAILLSDRKFAGSDTWATANALSAAVKHIGEFDLIMCGRQAIDGDTAQVGPQLAENLGIPQITYVQKLEIQDGMLKAERELEDGYEIVEGKLPVLITAIGSLNEPRYPNVGKIVEACNEKEVKVWDAETINADESQFGLLNSPTRVKKTFTPSKQKQAVKLEGSVNDIAKKLVTLFKEKEILQEF